MVPALRQRLGELPEPTSTDPDTERYLLYGAVVGLLAQASQAQPVVLVLEDLHWSDKPSLQLLRHVVANVESARVLVLGTFRDSELSASHPLTEVLGALRREAGRAPHRAAGLRRHRRARLHGSAAGHQLGDEVMDLVHAVYRETDGNPFFVGEVLRNLTETGAIAQDDTGRWSATQDLSEMALPTSVREVIGARVARLGERGEPSALRRGGDRPRFRLRVARRGLRPERRRSARSPRRRRSGRLGTRAHRCSRPLEFLARADPAHAVSGSRRDPPRPRPSPGSRGDRIAVRRTPRRAVGELAHHWFSATQPVNTAKAISYARQAAEAALTALAPDDAVRYYSQALQLVALTPGTDPLVDCDLRIGLGEAQRQAGIAAFRETLLEAAQRAQAIGATDRLVQAALANTRGFRSNAGVIDADKVATLEAALAALPEADSTERALLLATLCSELALGTPLEERKRLADDARAMARRIGDPATLMRVLYLVGNPIMVPSLLAERVADTAEALAIAETLGEPALLQGVCLCRHHRDAIRRLRGG